MCVCARAWLCLYFWTRVESAASFCMYMSINYAHSNMLIPYRLCSSIECVQKWSVTNCVKSWQCKMYRGRVDVWVGLNIDRNTNGNCTFYKRLFVWFATMVSVCACYIKPFYYHEFVCFWFRVHSRVHIYIHCCSLSNKCSTVNGYYMLLVVVSFWIYVRIFSTVMWTIDSCAHVCLYICMVCYAGMCV